MVEEALIVVSIYQNLDWFVHFRSLSKDLWMDLILWTLICWMLFSFPFQQHRILPTLSTCKFWSLLAIVILSKYENVSASCCSFTNLSMVLSKTATSSVTQKAIRVNWYDSPSALKFVYGLSRFAGKLYMVYPNQWFRFGGKLWIMYLHSFLFILSFISCNNYFLRQNNMPGSIRPPES